MPAYSQSTMRSPSGVAMKFALSRSLWQGVNGCSPRARSISTAVACAVSNAAGMVTPRSAAVSRYVSTTRNELKWPGTSGPSWMSFSARAAARR